MTKDESDKHGKLGKPLVLRLYQEQKDVLDEYVRKENKDLVNNGHSPRAASEYARWVFQMGLDALKLK